MSKVFNLPGLEIAKAFWVTLPYPFLMIDSEGSILCFNHLFEQLAAAPGINIKGKPLAEALYGGIKLDKHGRYRSPLLETLETGKEFLYKPVLIKSVYQQTPVTYLVSSVILRDEQNNISGAYAIYHDILNDKRFLKRAVMNHMASLSEQFETIYAFVEAIGARDLYTMGHSEKVAEYARLIAESMGLNEKEVDLAYLCGIVHDIGKIGVPEHILNKPGALTSEEFHTIKSHPNMGADILSHISWLEDIVPVVVSHHERFDGKGYPLGLKGNDIPIIGRILAVADAFDAMTSDRSYRKAYSLDKALEELMKNTGTQFDPQIVQIFINLLDEYNS